MKRLNVHICNFIYVNTSIYIYECMTDTYHIFPGIRCIRNRLSGGNLAQVARDSAHVSAGSH